MPAAYVARDPWNSARPGVLVIACSDGRIQEPVDEFLATLGVTHYDRLYVPGGPGALTAGGVAFVRADQFRRECAFLIQAHGVEDVFLIFHSPAEVIRHGFGWNVDPRIHAYRCEVTADSAVQFVRLEGGVAPFMPPAPLAF